ncbi:GNAT family N-acetyltransferase [Flavobacterium sp. Sd200]|uniref:GNAT family N-acetyltransferase n=1 Tax=Flavobacterium sp. Sd200 TaxID=2692211 RepID=UPI00136E51C6|nr:GNAT family N-acetyltransferase [Flavobacterium sp. Sd200]MXN92936.1 GNAT family N-acetyltransferase [Flavobacterium sp. Sd200]
MYTIQPYNIQYYDQWNDFVARSKNGTFLFHRDFMEYHADRFTDYSLLVFNDNKLVALLPANRVGDVVYSHQGLTYGGILLTAQNKLADVIHIVRAILKYLNDRGITAFSAKSIPDIYHKMPAQEMEYTLFVAGAKLVRRDGLSVYDILGTFPFTKKRLEAIRRGEKNNLLIVEEPNFDLFWNEILIPNLKEKHEAAPVHTAEEIKFLHSKFPENIRHFNVYNNGTIVAGTTVFITDTVAKPQYISGNPDKNQLGSLDYLYNHLIRNVFKEKQYFDLGPSHDPDSRKLKEGIIFWKESFGARTLNHDFYEVPTVNFINLDNALI